MDYYNSNLDIFLDLPVEGSRYPLQLLFDYEDRYIKETRRVVAESRRVVKKPKLRRVRQKEIESGDEEERSARERRERELAAALFADDEALKQKTPKKRRAQMDGEKLQKEGPPSDWDEELFGPRVPDLPEKSESQAPVGPRLYPGFSPYKSPKASNLKDAGEFDPQFDASPASQTKKTRTPTIKPPASASEPIPSRQIKVSSSQQIGKDGDVSMASSAVDAAVDSKRESTASNDVAMTDILSAESTSQPRQRQESEVVEQPVEERLFVNPGPLESRASVESYGEMDSSMIISPNGKVKADASQMKTAIVEEEGKPVVEERLQYRY